jgi:uncharacterized protein
MILCLPTIHPPAIQAPAPSVEGEWEGVIRLPEAALKIRVSLKREGADWRGKITIPLQKIEALDLEHVDVDGTSLRFAIPGPPGDPRFQGELSKDGRLIQGEFSQGSQRAPFLLNRLGSSAQSAPREVATDPGIRFPGFNQVALRGSVLASSDHPYFALLVADAGLTDRDWSNPTKRDARAGRAFATWLQAQGIGSLRFDKRFIGATDPKLDVSLDAQVGDIKAALAAARTLPQAKGKKLLLIGHGEGALLSLIAAGEADALLMIGLPAKPYAALIEDQLIGLLHAQKVSDETVTMYQSYLRACLNALRQGKSVVPDAPAGVDANTQRLMKALFQTETRAFTRALLDIDPWPLVSRLAIPSALVYGDRDVQTPKPLLFPKNYGGELIDLSGANHLLRRETRPRAELTNASALSAYGDDTPMAELSPIAAWLKNLH